MIKYDGIDDFLLSLSFLFVVFSIFIIINTIAFIKKAKKQIAEVSLINIENKS
jgi:hypothetical protein